MLGSKISSAMAPEFHSASGLSHSIIKISSSRNYCANSV